MTRQQCVEKYGAIDFASRYWPDQKKHMGMLEIPSTWFPNWVVAGTKIQVKHIYCNNDMNRPLFYALQSISAEGLGGELHTFDGCFNIRAVRGSSSFSLHSYGLALDIYAARNPMSYILRTTFSDRFIKCFKEQGFYWGGDWKGRKDAMHFSYGVNG